MVYPREQSVSEEGSLYLMRSHVGPHTARSPSQCCRDSANSRPASRQPVDFPTQLAEPILGKSRLLYSAGQQKSTNLLAPELDFFRANGPRNRDQGAGICPKTLSL